jgi:ABC-type uncharacterized transport system involved in gliding motility auxiliary subunit
MTRVVFDEYHKDCLKIKNTNKSGLSILATSLSNSGFSVSATIQPLETSIKNADVFVISFPCNNFNAVEIATIKTFVKNGGGLLILGEWSSTDIAATDAIIKLANEFGVKFNTDRIITSSDIGGSKTDYIKVDKFANHPITKNLRMIACAAACSLKMPATQILAWTPELSFGDLNLNLEWDMSEEVGRLGIACFLESGKGRIVAVGDTSFATNEHIETGDNKKFLVNIMQWLSRKI